MKLRAALLASAVLAGAVFVGSSQAAGPCNLIVDPAGDSEYGAPLDITGADIASDGKKVTAVIRLAEVNKSNGSAPTGQGWYFHFQPAGAATPLFLSAASNLTTSEAFNFGWLDGTINRSLGVATGVFDTARKEIRITAPATSWAERGSLKSGTKLSAVTATGYWYIGATVNGTGAGSLQTGDEAATTKTYNVGDKNCVVVGA